jgi:hypothetical protein
MKKTIKDLEKASSAAVSWFKYAVYYLYMPAVVALGASTINWSNLIGAPQV